MPKGASCVSGVGVNEQSVICSLKFP